MLFNSASYTAVVMFHRLIWRNNKKITSEKISEEMYVVCLKNYSTQTADDHEYSVGLDWKLTES